jgi:glycosyltransferase involved in cell wall biosynthesis
VTDTPRIGIDARNIALPHGTGIATYATTLAQALPLIAMQPAILYAGPPRSRLARWHAAARAAASHARAQPGGWTADDLFRIAQVQFDIRRTLRTLRFQQPPALMHWTSPLPLYTPDCPNLVTLHDLIPVLHPALTGTDPRRHRRLLMAVLHRADHVLAVSDATRQEAIHHLGLPPGRITTVWQAVDVAGAAPIPPANLAPGAYWLHVGAVERRKNLVRLIHAWRASAVDGPLVLAGPDGWHAAEVAAAAAGDPRIIRLPWLARTDLLALIRDARALILPSLAEGFGLPLAEAMALATPAITANTGALAEVAGTAALLVDPAATRDVARAIATLDTDRTLRQRLAAAGPPRAARFTPAAHAARLEPVYRAFFPGTAGPVAGTRPPRL